MIDISSILKMRLKLTIDRYFVNSENEIKADNILKLLNENFCSFKEIVHKFKNEFNLHILLRNEKLFEELIEDNRLNIEDLKYLLNRIDKWHELHHLCENTSLIKKILNEFLFNTEIIDKFNAIIEKEDENTWYKENNIHTVFDRIEYENKNNAEVLKLIELNRKVYSFNFNDDQKLELTEILKDSDIAKIKLNEIIENHLEDNYNFESLMSYLKKAEKKTLLNI